MVQMQANDQSVTGTLLWIWAPWIQWLAGGVGRGLLKASPFSQGVFPATGQSPTTWGPFNPLLWGPWNFPYFSPTYGTPGLGRTLYDDPGKVRLFSSWFSFKTPSHRLSHRHNQSQLRPRTTSALTYGYPVHPVTECHHLHTICTRLISPQ